MADNEELHDVVKLLLARMESHPEEFRDEYLMADLQPTIGHERWDRALRAINQYGTPEDKQAIIKVLGAIRMDQVHEWTLDELLNGDERRRKRREEEANYTMMQQQTALHQQTAMSQAQLYNNQYSNAQNYLRYQPGPDAYEFTQQGFTTTYTRETLEDNPGILAGIKKALGL